MKKPVRKLPRDLYDTLHFVSLIYGGVGKNYWSVDGPQHKNEPCCIHGMAEFAAGHGISASKMREAMRQSGITIYTNDAAVKRVLKRKKQDTSSATARISFAEWCRELNVQPAEQT